MVEVTADGLAVRSQPSASAPLVAAWESADGEWRRVADEVRLEAGHLITVTLGPITVDDIVWYRAREKVQGDQDPTRHWDATGEGPQGETQGWIATREGEEAYVRLHEAGGDDPGWVRVASAGEGDAVSGPFPPHDLLQVEWAISHADGPGACEIRVAIEDSASRERAVEVVAESVHDTFAQGRSTADGADLEPLEGASGLRLRVDAGCDWALVLSALPHD